jgi:hypothetical protein
MKIWIFDDKKLFRDEKSFMNFLTKEIKDGTYRKLNGWVTKVTISEKRKKNFMSAKKSIG